MKRLVFQFFLSIITFQCVNAQNAEFTLSGNISDCETHKNLKGIKLKLMCSDGRSLETFTDSLGNYFFGSSTIKINRQYIISTRTEIDLGYLNSSEKYKFETFDSVSIKNVKKDFCLSKRGYCSIRDTNLTNHPVQTYSSVVRSTQKYYKVFKLTDSTFHKETSLITYSITFKLGSSPLDTINSALFLDSLKSFLTTHPTIKIEIRVHSDSRMCKQEEIMSRKLFKARAESIVQYLMSKGIDERRLVGKGYGCYRLLINENEILKLKDKNEIEKAHAKNRRVEIYITEYN